MGPILGQQVKVLYARYAKSRVNTWTFLYYVSLCFQGVDSLLLYMLMISRGGGGPPLLQGV